MKTGCVNLPLHGGKCPKWLFPRMKKLSGAISEIIVDEFGQEEFLKRISNPYFFQSFGCIIGFDWHSSGLSTTTLGALKESLDNMDIGIKIAGGKGKTSRKAPNEIENISDEFNLSENKKKRLIYSSKMSAKVDSNLIQDGYSLYHHSFFVAENGSWAVVQQGMNEKYARRYHWLSDNITSFVLEPNTSICGDKKEENVLNMTAKESDEAQKISLDLVNDNPSHLKKYFKEPIQKDLNYFFNDQNIFSMNSRHEIIDMNKRGMDMLNKAYEMQPKTYEELVAIKGIGAKSIRSLALISDLVYGKPASWRDPVKYSFAHGGKDGIPYPVNRKLMDENTELLKDAIISAKIGDKDRLNAIKRLTEFLRY